MCITRSALIHRTSPVSTSAIWNREGAFETLALPSAKRTSHIHESASCLTALKSAPISLTQTVKPALTLRNSGATSGAGNTERLTGISTGLVHMY